MRFSRTSRLALGLGLFCFPCYVASTKSIRTDPPRSFTAQFYMNRESVGSYELVYPPIQVSLRDSNRWNPDRNTCLWFGWTDVTFQPRLWQTCKVRRARCTGCHWLALVLLPLTCVCSPSYWLALPRFDLLVSARIGRIAAIGSHCTRWFALAVSIILARIGCIAHIRIRSHRSYLTRIGSYRS